MQYPYGENVDVYSDAEKRFVSGTSEDSCSVLWTVMFNPMVYESCPLTISIHRTKSGAVKAMRDLKTAKFTEQDWVEFDHKWTSFHYGKMLVQE